MGKRGRTFPSAGEELTKQQIRVCRGLRLAAHAKHHLRMQPCQAPSPVTNGLAPCPICCAEEPSNVRRGQPQIDPFANTKYTPMDGRSAEVFWDQSPCLIFLSLRYLPSRCATTSTRSTTPPNDRERDQSGASPNPNEIRSDPLCLFVPWSFCPCRFVPSRRLRPVSHTAGQAKGPVTSRAAATALEQSPASVRVRT